MRGLTIWFMNLVNNASDPLGYAALDHAPWNGITIADFVMPFFLFMVGASTAFAYQKPLEQGVSKWSLLKKAIIRSLKLFGIGIALGNTPPYNLAHVRIMGVLQRIGICYLIGCMAVIFIPKLPYTGKKFKVLPTYALQFVVPLVLLVLYIVVVFGIPLPPGCPYQDRLQPNCNTVGWLDAQILGVDHLYVAPTCKEATPPCPYFDPEGLTTTFVASVSVFIGLYYGYFIPLYRGDHKARLIQWGVTSLILLTLGLILGLTNLIPFNKNLYSISYILLMGGAAGFCLMGFYIIQDVYMIRKPLLPLTWLGMNSIMYVFLLFRNYACFKSSSDQHAARRPYDIASTTSILPFPCFLLPALVLAYVGLKPR